MKLKFEGKIWRAGNSSVVTIPFDYVKNGMVPEDVDLWFTVDVPEADNAKTITDPLEVPDDF